MFEDQTSYRPSRTRGGARGGVRSCSVSVVCTILCIVNGFVFRLPFVVMCLDPEVPLDLLL